MSTSYSQRVKFAACKGGIREITNELSVRNAVGLPKQVLQLPLKLTFHDLKSAVAKKFGLSKDSGFRMTYQFPVAKSAKKKNHGVVDIVDDEDAELFIQMASYGTDELVTMYVVVPYCLPVSSAKPPSAKK